MRVTLKRGADKQLQKGYPWVFANQIYATSGDPTSGDVVEIVSGEGKVYGLGLYHESSLIAIRFLTRDPEQSIDADFFRKRLERALSIRNAAFGDSDSYRVVFSESDGMPGTIIDRYGDVFTWTCISYGMEQRREEILDQLAFLVGPRAVVERNDNSLREKDGLPQGRGVIRGEVDSPITIDEYGLRFQVDVLEGPKTGFFMDQRLHRLAVRRMARDRRVLDVFCADGGFGLNAAHGGARSVHFMDVSDGALERVASNARLNGLTRDVTTEQADALDRLGDMAGDTGQYDMIILDPPAFAKSRKQVEGAIKAYQRININAMQMLPPGGILATASCSQAVAEADFLKIIRYAAKKTGTRLRLLHRGSQPPDHPVLDAMPETHYLKFYLFEKAGDELP
jgi:23S rRNA (cytosine1962-C5)-methyltransferase